jgi:hypothetical protein
MSMPPYRWTSLIDRVTITRGEHAGRTGEAYGVIPKRYSREPTMVRVRLDGLPGGVGEVTVDEGWLEKQR